VGVGGYLVWKHLKASKATPSVTPAIPPANTSAAGYGYGAYGYGAEYGYGSEYGYGYGPYGYGFGAMGGGGYPSYYGYGTTTTATTNAAWAQNVTAQLTNQGYSGTAILTALGLYLDGGTVVQGSQNDTIIQAAEAIGGPPPQQGAGGFPPAIHYGTGGGGTGQTVGGYQAYAPGGKRLDQLTVPGVTYDELAAKNPGVAAKYSGKPLPKGTAYYVPKEPAPSS
jgi:hypothetical protein